jgi:O-antigen ligase
MVGVVLFLVAIIALPRKMLTLGMALAVVILALYLAGPEVRDRFASIWVKAEDRDVSAASRKVTWTAAWRCMCDHPMGVGPRNFNLISQNYGLDINKSVHNLFLQTGADYGFFGMIGLFVFYFGAVVQTFLVSRTATARRLVWPHYYCQMVVVSLAGFLTCSMFIGMEAVEVGFIIALLGLCTVVHVREIERAEPQPEAEKHAGAESMPEEGQADLEPLVGM